MGALKPWHIILLVVVIVVIFGSKRLPDAARSLGRSMRIMKAETKGLMDDDKQSPTSPTRPTRRTPASRSTGVTSSSRPSTRCTAARQRPLRRLPA